MRYTIFLFLLSSLLTTISQCAEVKEIASTQNNNKIEITKPSEMPRFDEIIEKVDYSLMTNEKLLKEARIFLSQNSEDEGDN